MTVRVDKWLWCVRVFKTRTKASDACSDGRVLVNDVVAKPATKVGVGDVVSARRGDRTIVYSVVEAVDKRVSAARAAACIEDRSPPAEPRDRPGQAVFARRDRGAGRPTKRDRRDIDRLRGRAAREPSMPTATASESDDRDAHAAVQDRFASGPAGFDLELELDAREDTVEPRRDPPVPRPE